ncbi:hypothetical protein GP486_004225 [Trichoglossum hirsutum]|uniref:Mannosyltransferase n=1 Tax=Trichoglossum hirsutum TaxID=265104 RepID=A0A9P8LBS8_9PEZI|nr:hypothetical protein GP486_004225 [Trichoglossum hirsutum]
MSPPTHSANGVTLDGRRPASHAAKTFSSRDVLLFLVALRIANSLSLQTFFQPDEYFQSLEPAWQMAFGKESGAWITWEWKHQLRSSIHPAIFASVYYVSSVLADLFKTSFSIRAEVLLAAPKVTQAVIAALGDYYTWKLGERVYGQGSLTAWATVCSEGNPSLSPIIKNIPFQSAHERDDTGLRIPRVASAVSGADELTSFGVCPSPNQHLDLDVCFPSTSTPGQWPGEVALLTSPRGLILALSVLGDRLYYQVWAFPPLRFLHFNIAQSLSIFYGRNDWHYYLSQGIPLLLTTALPFGVLGIWRTLHSGHFINLQLAVTALSVTSILSLISHKEVRFIYPILPALHILTAEALVSTVYPSQRNPRSPPRPQAAAPRIAGLWKYILSILLATNILLALYTTLIHQSGVLSVLTYLRKEHGSRNTTTTIGFLMPCHSTPWRSHLIHPSIHAWALTCEPPINLDPAARATYLDEADVFYADAGSFLHTRFAPPPLLGHKMQGSPEQRQWPDNIVFFEQLQPVLADILRDSGYVECWRGFNSHWHDDWRREGDVIVWCLQGF